MKSFLIIFQSKELIRFLVVGSCSVITDCLTYWFFLKFGCDVNFSKFLGFICGSVVGFIFNKLWTFESNGQIHREVFRYSVLYATTLMLNVWSNQIVLDIVHIWWLAFLFATALSTICNFLGMKYFVFHQGIAK